MRHRFGDVMDAFEAHGMVTTPVDDNGAFVFADAPEGQQLVCHAWYGLRPEASLSGCQVVSLSPPERMRVYPAGDFGVRFDG